MKISIALKESIYDCKIRITDSAGSRDYYIKLEDTCNIITAEVFNSDFTISLIPVMAEITPIINEIEENTWKDKLAKKASNILVNLLEKMVLRVGCDYAVCNISDGDRLDITLQNYIFDTFDRFDLLELLPMCYAFFEVANFNKFYKLKNTCGLNRKDVIKFARSFALGDILGNGLFGVLFSYPIQVFRIKHLSKNKKVFKTLRKFNNFTDDERQAFLNRQDKYLS